MKAKDGPSLREIVGLQDQFQQIYKNLDARAQSLIRLFRAIPDAKDPFRETWQKTIETVATKIKDFSFVASNGSSEFHLDIQKDLISKEDLGSILANVKSVTYAVDLTETDSVWSIRLINKPVEVSKPSKPAPRRTLRALHEAD